MRVGIAADHAGFYLKESVAAGLREAGYDLVDLGAYGFYPGDDYPDLVIPLARAVGSGECDRGVAVCGSGVGACVAANKVKGARAALVGDVYTAHQGVEHDDMNIICIGARVSGEALVMELVRAFLGATFKADDRFVRRLEKVMRMER
ncbi:MAG: RpiB/LacA/LacB family sugar-phosphate isomerase [Chitinispirillaceae bacterium]